MVSPRRGADAEGGRDPGDGRQPAARLRPRLRAARGGAHRRPAGAPAAQRARLHASSEFYAGLRARGITIWGAAVDTLENTSRFAEGKATGPDGGLPPLRLAAHRLAPVRVVHGLPHRAAARGRGRRARSLLLDYRDAAREVTRGDRSDLPRHQREQHPRLDAAAARAAPGGSASCGRSGRRSACTSSRTAGRRPSGLRGLHRLGHLRADVPGRELEGRRRRDTHVFLCDGYAATAEAMQAASLVRGARRRRIDGALLAAASSCPCERRGPAHAARPRRARLRAAARERVRRAGRRRGAGRSSYAEAIREADGLQRAARASRVLRADDFLPEKNWRRARVRPATCATTRTPARAGVDAASPTSVYRVTTRLATREASSPHHVHVPAAWSRSSRRATSSARCSSASCRAWTTRRAPVKISDSGRIRNELQTMFSQALEHDGDRIRVHFDRIDEKVMPKESQRAIRDVLEWYKPSTRCGSAGCASEPRDDRSDRGADSSMSQAHAASGRARAAGLSDERCAILRAELSARPAQVACDRRRLEAEIVCDPLVRQPHRGERHDLALAM